MVTTLANYFNVNSRYRRSINLERDLRGDGLPGYILTERAIEALRRISRSLLETDESLTRTWTLTGVYGTGKSAFAHFLACLCGAESDPIRDQALELVRVGLGDDDSDYQRLVTNLPKKGLFRAVVTAGREPCSYTLVRALAWGVNDFWGGGKMPKVGHELIDLVELMGGDNPPEIDNQRALNLLQRVAKVAEVPVLLVIDEFGKNLEFVANNGRLGDLYLWQQVAELPQRSGQLLVNVIALLHQAFDDYGDHLTSVEQNEWAKIHGRFAEIAFADSGAGMTYLIGEAINRDRAADFLGSIRVLATEWFENLSRFSLLSGVTRETLNRVYPLHPVSALTLPELCLRYAQNDRSLFTFLASDEPFGFRSFLESTPSSVEVLPTLKIPQIYDYFVESVGLGLSNRNYSKWLEIKDLISDAKFEDLELQDVLKSIGIFNLISSSMGVMRARRDLVELALCDRPGDLERKKFWGKQIELLLKKGFVTHYRQGDELRLWQGSDFNVDQSVEAYIRREDRSLRSLLELINPLKPMIAQRHSYEKGCLRFFECRYVDESTSLAELTLQGSHLEGLIAYWVGAGDVEIPSQTRDGKPLVVVRTKRLDFLRGKVLDLVALEQIENTARELQTDGVARREVRHRLTQAKRLFVETTKTVFNPADPSVQCWFLGEIRKIKSFGDFNQKLSEVFDHVYYDSPIVKNEQINRRVLSLQGTRARKLLIAAMLEQGHQERLGLTGYGPEVAIYISLLEKTGIHRCIDGVWQFCPPDPDSGIFPVWKKIEDFCLGAKSKHRSFKELVNLLTAPPFGVKGGLIPIFIMAVLLYHFDDLGLYQDGTFLTLMIFEKVELMLKDPTRYGVKYFELMGLRSQVFRELEAFLRSPDPKLGPETRNKTILAVVKPLYQFYKQLPDYTKKSGRLSGSAQGFLRALELKTEPDELLFTALPIALGFEAIKPDAIDDENSPNFANILRQKLVNILREIHRAYEELISDGKSLLKSAFGLNKESEKLREELRSRGQYLLNWASEPKLKRFLIAVVDESKDEQAWLEAVMMIIADKPASSWKDADVVKFETELSNIARHFQNLESLCREKDKYPDPREGLEARKITVLQPNGEELNRLVWNDQQQKPEIEQVAAEILAVLKRYDDPNIRQAAIALVMEQVLGHKEQEL